MDKTQKVILCSLVAASVASWFASQVFQNDIMSAMGAPSALSLSVFTSVWTVGMAAMMFPAIVPMVMLYSTLANSGGQEQLAGSFFLWAPTLSCGRSPESRSCSAGRR